MSVTPADIISLPLKYLRDTIAASATFQSWVGAANAAAALAYVHAVVATDGTPPFVVVDWGNYRRVKDSFGEHHNYRTEGDLRVVVRGPIAHADDADAAFEFFNKLGAIIGEMEEISGTAGYLDWESLSIESFDRPNEEEIQSTGQDYYQANLIVPYEDHAQ